MAFELIFCFSFALDSCGFQSDISDDIDYDFFPEIRRSPGDHNYTKRKEDKPTVLETAAQPNDALTDEQNAVQMSVTQQNGVSTTAEVANANKSNEKVHANAISTRDPRCRKRANESETQNNDADHMNAESVCNTNGEVHEKDDDTEAPNNDETIAEDEDVLDIFGDDDYFDEQNDFDDPKPKRARIEVEKCRTSKAVPVQQPQPPKSVSETIQRPVVPSGPFKIPKLSARVINSNQTQVTIQNDSVTKRPPQIQISVAQQNVEPPQASTSTGNIGLNERMPVKQRLGLLQGMNPSHLARTVVNKSNDNRRGIQNGISAAPKPMDVASRNRILQASQRLLPQNKQKNADPATAAAPAIMASTSQEYVMPSFVVNPLENQPAFNVLFRNMCRRFIGDKCALIPSACPFSHTLPDPASIRAKLEDIGQRNAIDVYQLFVLRSKKLFTRYVPIFCDYFGAHKLETLLVETIAHCRHQERRYYTNFTDIVDGFVKAGHPYHTSLRKLINEVKKRTMQASNVILKLILDERNTRLELFFNVLDSMVKQDGFVFPIESMNRLLRIFVSRNDNNDELMMLIWSILTKFPDQSRMDNELLTQFCSMTALNMGNARAEPPPH